MTVPDEESARAGQVVALIAAIEATAAAILAIDRSGTVRHASVSAERLFGCPSGTRLTGRAIAQFLPDLAAASGASVSETIARRPDGTAFIASVRLVSSADGSTLVIEDAAVRQESEARSANEAARALLGRILPGVAREIEAALVLVERASRGADSSEVDARARIAAETGRALATTRRLLAATASAGPSSTQIPSANEVAADAYALAAAELAQRNVRVRVEPAARPPALAVDRSRTLRASLALVLAAAEQAGPGGEVVLEVGYDSIRGAATLRAALRPCEVRIGPPPPLKSDPAFRVARRDAESMGGWVQVERGAHVPASLTLELPATPSAHGAPAQQRPVVVVGARPTRGRVLIADDEQVLGELAAEILRARGFTVDLVVTGAEALALAVEREYELIVADLYMPGVGARKLHETLLEKRPSVANRILIITGDALRTQTQEFLKETGLSCLAKPFGTAQLAQAVEEAIARSASQAPR